jgi:hypothetical protein
MLWGIALFRSAAVKGQCGARFSQSEPCTGYRNRGQSAVQPTMDATITNGFATDVDMIVTMTCSKVDLLKTNELP